VPSREPVEPEQALPGGDELADRRAVLSVSGNAGDCALSLPVTRLSSR
jgi:hypothetical protein